LDQQGGAEAVTSLRVPEIAHATLAGVPQLQRLKSQGLCCSWRNWLEDEAGLAEESVQWFGVVLEPLEAGLHEGDELVDAGGGAVAQYVSRTS
jgi:hypothetical protein